MAGRRVGIRNWIAIELIAPQHIEKGTAVDLIESSPHWICRRFTNTAATLLQRRIAAAGVSVLQAPFFVAALHGATKGAGPLDVVTAIGGRLAIELEGE